MIVTSRPNIRCDICHSQPQNLKILKLCFFLCFFLIVSNFLPSYTIGNETAMLIRCRLLTIYTPDSGRATTVYGICTLADAEALVSGLDNARSGSTAVRLCSQLLRLVPAESVGPSRAEIRAHSGHAVQPAYHLPRLHIVLVAVDDGSPVRPAVQSLAAGAHDPVAGRVPSYLCADDGWHLINTL